MPNGPKELIVLPKLSNLFSGLGRILCNVQIIDNNNSFVPVSHLSLEDSELYSIPLILNNVSESLDSHMISTILIFAARTNEALRGCVTFSKSHRNTMKMLWKGV